MNIFTINRPDWTSSLDESSINVQYNGDWLPLALYQLLCAFGLTEMKWNHWRDLRGSYQQNTCMN